MKTKEEEKKEELKKIQIKKAAVKQISKLKRYHLFDEKDIFI